MLADATAIALLVALLVGLGIALRREDTRLRRISRRYRELELEGIEELRRGDPYPEERVGGSWMREPDGSAADADRVLHEELERARRHTRRLGSARASRRSMTRAKGAECLL
jgi:hypothetical protein